MASVIKILNLIQLEQSKGRYADHDKAIHMYLQAHSIAGSK